MYFKTGSKYREVMALPQIEVCSTLKTATTNNLLMQIVEIFRMAAPSSVHECPYEFIEAYNVTAPVHNFIMMLPSGDYKIDFDFKIGTAYVILTIEFSVNSIKDRMQ